MSQMPVLDGKVALVVGAGQSWLQPLVTSLIEAGARVAVLSGDEKMTPLMVADSGDRLQIIDSGTLDYAAISRVVERVVSRWGGLDILVNSMNVRFAKPALDVTDAEWQRVLDVNLRGVFDACRAAGAQMLKQGYGKIINITSCLGERGMANSSVYCAAAGGVIQLTRALAVEWARKGISVNAVALGWIHDGQSTVDERVARFVPLRRYGNPEELTPLVVYLASPASDYLTGQVYSIDGGITSRV